MVKIKDTRIVEKLPDIYLPMNRFERHKAEGHNNLLKKVLNTELAINEIAEVDVSRILKLTNVVRNCSECELDYGTLKTLKMIDDTAKSSVLKWKSKVKE